MYSGGQNTSYSLRILCILFWWTEYRILSKKQNTDRIRTEYGQNTVITKRAIVITNRTPSLSPEFRDLQAAAVVSARGPARKRRAGRGGDRVAARESVAASGGRDGEAGGRRGEAARVNGSERTPSAASTEVSTRQQVEVKKMQAGARRSVCRRAEQYPWQGLGRRLHGVGDRGDF